MLEIIINNEEFYQQATNKFIQIPDCTITLEHSLISVAKWESKWHIPYFSETEKTAEQELDYIRCMLIGTLKDNYIFEVLSIEHILQIKEYIDNPMTATTFKKKKEVASKKEAITAEIIYYRMFVNDIPIECQKWHLNRLLTLIRVCDLKNNSSSKKMSKQETAMWYAEQNAARRARLNTRG